MFFFVENNIGSVQVFTCDKAHIRRSPTVTPAKAPPTEGRLGGLLKVQKAEEDWTHVIEQPSRNKKGQRTHDPDKEHQQNEKHFISHSRLFLR